MITLHFIAKCFVCMRTSEENGVANEVTILEWVDSRDFEVVT